MMIKSNHFCRVKFLVEKFGHCTDEDEESRSKKNSDVIRMRDEERRSGKENPLKKRWIIPHFYDVTC